jgi:hypothetical protein
LKLMKLLVVLALALALAGVAVAAPGPPVPKFPRFPGDWSHADVNVVVKRVPHTLTLDRGRIVQISTTQLTLREKDGSMPTIPITPDTIVTILGRPATILDLRKKELAETLRVDGGPAVRLRVTAR